MGLLDDAIREHLELKRRHGAREDELARQEAEALGPVEEGELEEIEPESLSEEPPEPAERHAGWPFDRVAEGDLAGPEEPSFEWEEGETEHHEVEVPSFVAPEPAGAGDRASEREFGDSPTVAFDAVEVSSGDPETDDRADEPAAAEEAPWARDEEDAPGEAVEPVASRDDFPAPGETAAAPIEEDIGSPLASEEAAITEPPLTETGDETQLYSVADAESAELLPETADTPVEVFTEAEADHPEALESSEPEALEPLESPGLEEEDSGRPPPLGERPVAPDPAAIEEAELADDPLSPEDPLASEAPEPAVAEPEDPLADADAFAEDSPADHAFADDPRAGDRLDLPELEEEDPIVFGETIVEPRSDYEPILEHGPLEPEPPATLDDPPLGEPSAAADALHEDAPDEGSRGAFGEPEPAAEQGHPPAAPYAPPDLDPSQPTQAWSIEDEIGVAGAPDLEEGSALDPLAPEGMPAIEEPEFEAADEIAEPDFPRFEESSGLVSAGEREEEIGLEPAEEPEALAEGPVERVDVADDLLDEPADLDEPPGLASEPPALTPADPDPLDEEGSDALLVDSPPPAARGFFEETGEHETLWREERQGADPDFEN